VDPDRIHPEMFSVIGLAFKATISDVDEKFR
jgi:hypothetical protein